MTAHALKSELDRIGRKVAAWRAACLLCFGLTGAAAGIALMSALDLWLRYGRAGRAVIWLALMGILGGTGFLVSRILSLKLTHQAVAALVERTFPWLDNHLINYVQFASDPESNAFKRAYVGKGIPNWEKVNVPEIRNRRRERASQLGLGIALLVLLLPAAFFGRAWGVAIHRVVNPFSDIQPVTLTRIVDVSPGSTTVLQGTPVVLAVDVNFVDSITTSELESVIDSMEAEAAKIVPEIKHIFIEAEKIRKPLAS